jgi:hypothetical protein
MLRVMPSKKLLPSKIQPPDDSAPREIIPRKTTSYAQRWKDAEARRRKADRTPEPSLTTGWIKFRTQVCGNVRLVNCKGGRPQFNQAIKVMTRFGGEAAMAEAIGVNITTVYSWLYPPPRGTNGLIPAPQIEPIKKAARIHGIVLTAHDWYPAAIDYPTIGSTPIKYRPKVATEESISEEITCPKIK